MQDQEIERLHTAIDKSGTVPKTEQNIEGLYARIEWLIAENRSMASALEIIRLTATRK
jgi:hypothetical protein